MNRMAEYNQLLQELQSPPKTLETTVERALNREKALQIKRRTFRVSAGSFAACFTLFVLLVNLFPPFAKACGNIPLLSALAEAVRFSPSLSAAVENEYVQPMDQAQTENGVTASVEHVIVDRKQVSIFFTLDADFTEHLDFEYDIEVPGVEMGWGSSTGSYGLANGELRQVDVSFMNIDVPDTMCLNLKVYDSTRDWAPNDAPPETIEGDYGDEMLSGRPREERAYLAEFDFTLGFDPTFTAKGEIVAVDRTFALDGQSVTVTEAEIYPTHLRLNFDYDEANTAWLKGLDFYLENEHGEQFQPTRNGISATGDTDTPAMASFWLDSPYFSQGERLTLYITGAEWLDKDHERVKVDLVNGTIDAPPQSVRIEWTEKRDGGWLLSSSAQYRWGSETMYDIWGRTYDAEGNEIEVNSTSMTNSPMFLGTLSGAELEAHNAYAKANQDRYFETFGLKGCTEDTVWLEPNWTTFTTQKTPIAVIIK